MNDIKELLDESAREINKIDFVETDPVQFPRMFSDQRDIEITALLVSAIAWGNRTMIIRDSNRLLNLMDRQPYAYMMEDGAEELNGEQNIHRTFFARDLKHFLRGLKAIYQHYGTLDNFCASCGTSESEYPAWHLAKMMNKVFADANLGKGNSRCLPLNTDISALKRLNMALRWLVRDDGIVDLGVWKSLTPDKLFIPLDVHVARVSRDLGLLERRSNDRKAVIELTETLRKFRPNDPVYYDYALFGIGVNNRQKPQQDLII